MIENFDTIKQNVLTLLGEKDSDVLNLKIRILVDECLAYCYRKTVPAEMELPLSDVIAKEIKMQGIIGIDGDVASYKEGDMQVSFASSTSNGSKYNGKLDTFRLVIGLQ